MGEPSLFLFGRNCYLVKEETLKTSLEGTSRTTMEIWKYQLHGEKSWSLIWFQRFKMFLSISAGGMIVIQRVANHEDIKGHISPGSYSLSVASGLFKKVRPARPQPFLRAEAYWPYVSTEKGRERRWRIFSTDPIIPNKRSPRERKTRLIRASYFRRLGGLQRLPLDGSTTGSCHLRDLGERAQRLGRAEELVPGKTLKVEEHRLRAWVP